LFAAVENKFYTFPRDVVRRDVDERGKVAPLRLVKKFSNFHKFSTSTLWIKDGLFDKELAVFSHIHSDYYYWILIKILSYLVIEKSRGQCIIIER
jgi:hypothetical protein